MTNRNAAPPRILLPTIIMNSDGVIEVISVENGMNNEKNNMSDETRNENSNAVSRNKTFF